MYTDIVKSEFSNPRIRTFRETIRMRDRVFFLIACVAVLIVFDRAIAHALCNIEFPNPPVSNTDSECPSADHPVLVSSHHVFSSLCNYAGVTFKIVDSNTTLDCAGQLLHSPDNEDLDARRSAIIVTSHLHDITIQNCFIRNHHRAVTIHGGVDNTQENELRRVYWRYENNLRERYRQLMALEDKIRETASSQITIRDVHVMETQHVGFYIMPYAQNVTLDRVSVRSNIDGPGIYLDSGSRYNRIRRACLTHTAREGIAVDASAYNSIIESRFESNTKGGIFLYKNPFENPSEHLPRTQHSRGNRIAGNVFIGEERAIWIASRAARNYANSSLEYGDPIVYSDGEYVHRRDYAPSNRIVANAFLDTRNAAVVVEDDHMLIKDNYFENSRAGDIGVYLGSRPRAWIGEPIYGAELSGNIFHVNVRYNVKKEYCAIGSLFVGNVTDHGSYSVHYDPGSSPCDEEEWRTRLHPTLITILP